MAQPKRTGRRAATQLVTSAQAPSASSAFLPRAQRRGKNRMAAATTAAAASFGAVLEYTQAGGNAEIDCNPANLSTNSATYEVWIKTTVKTKQMLFQTAYTQPFIYIENDQIAVQWVGANADPNYCWVSADTAVISDGEWHHIAVVFNNNAITFYKDGIATADALSVNQSEIANHPVFMGGAWADVPSFIGQMWDIKIWAYAFTAGLIQADMFNAIPPIELPPLLTRRVLATAINVATNTFTNLANGATATLTNCDVTWDALPQPPTFALEIPGGGSDYVDIGSLSAAVSSTAATFECWIKMSTATGVSTTPQTIVLVRGSDPSGASPRIEYDGGDKLGVYWNVNGPHSADTTPISDGAWHHIAVVFNNNQVTFYKDGIPTNEAFTMSATQTSGGDLQVGPALGSTQAFNGQIYDVRVWNVARSVGDIQSFMYATLTGTESGLVGLNNLSYYAGSNTVKNQVNGDPGGVAGNAKVIETIGPQSQQPVPQSIWTYNITGIAPLGPQISPKGLVYAENVAASNNGPAGNYLRSLDLQDHTLNWTYSVHDNTNIPTPVIPAAVGIGSTTAYVAAQAHDTTGSTIVELHAVDLGTGKPVWDGPTTLTACNVVTKPVEAGNYIVMGANNVNANDGSISAALYWIDMALGRTVQSHNNLSGPATFMSDPVVRTITINGTPTPIAIAAFSFKPNPIAPGLTIVAAFSLFDGSFWWEHNPGHYIGSNITMDQDRLYMAGQDGGIVAMNIADGTIAWSKVKTNLPINSVPVVIGTALYVGSTDGNLYAFDSATGNDLWQLNTGSAIVTDLITEDGAIYFATQGNGAELPPTFFSVDAASLGNDTLIYPVPDADTILFAQGQSNGVVYFYSKQNVYAVNMDMILHEFNVDTKLTVEDYDTTTNNPVGNDTSYRITITLNDPLNVPRVNQAVKIWASGTVYLSNRLDSSGNPILIGPDTPYLAQTDAGGQVSLAVSAYDDGSHGGSGSSASPLVNCPAIYAWANFMMPGEAIVIYPDHEHMSSLSNVQGVSTTKAQAAARSYAVASTLYLGQATTYDNSKLISSDYQDSTSLANIATTIRNTIGTRNTPSTARVTAVGDAGNPASKYIAYPASMPNVNYASDNTQPVTRPFVPADGAANQTFTMDISGATGKPTSIQPGTFDNSRPSNLPAPIYPPWPASSTKRIHIAGIGEVQAIDSIGDFFKHVVKGLEKVAKVAWQWTTNAVNTVIHTAESIYTLTIQTLEDAVTAVVGFFKSVVADLKKVIEWLSALFDWGAIIENHNTIKGYITNTQKTGVFDQMQTWITREIGVLGTVESNITNVFGQVKGKGQSTVTSTGAGLAGQTVQSQQGSNSNPNDVYNTGGNNNATQCKFMQHKAMENGTGLTAPAPFRPYHAYLPWVAQNGGAANAPGIRSVSNGPDADTIINAMVAFVEAVGAKIESDFKDLPAQVQAAINILKDKFKDPKSIIANGFTDILAVLAVIADDLIALGVEIAKDFLTLVNTLLGQLMALATETIDVPFVSRLYQSITDNPLTVLDMIALIGAVPTTILMEVLTGAKTPTAAAVLRAKALAQPMNVAIDEVGQIFLGIFNFAVNAFGSWLDAYTFWWNGTKGDTTATQTLANRADAIKGFLAWCIGMAVSQAWSSWGEWDWFYWGSQVFPVFYNLYGLFFSIPTIENVDMDVFSGLVNLVLSAIWAGLWPSNYLNAPKAPALALFTNIFGSLGYLVEAGYYAQAVVGQDLAATAVALGKLILEEVNAILGFTAYVLTVVHPSSSSAQLTLNAASRS